MEKYNVLIKRVVTYYRTEHIEASSVGEAFISAEDKLAKGFEDWDDYWNNDSMEILKVDKDVYE